MFPGLWSNVRIIHGRPLKADISPGAPWNPSKGFSSMLTFDVPEGDITNDNHRSVYPKAVTAMTAYSGGVRNIDDPVLERMLASQVLLEATKTGVMARLLEANRFGQYFSYADLNELCDTDGYFSWFAILKAMDESGSFLYNRTDLALGAMRALSGGIMTVSQLVEGGKDRDTMIKKVLSKFPIFGEEFRAVCSVFYNKYVAQGTTPHKLLSAVEYLISNDYKMVDPKGRVLEFKNLDARTKEHADYAIEETNAFLEAVKKAFPERNDWFLTSILGETAPLTQPMNNRTIWIDRPSYIPERAYRSTVEIPHSSEKTDATGMMINIICEKVPGHETLMPEIGRMKIFQGFPEKREMADAIKDPVSNKEYLVVRFEQRPGVEHKSQSKRFPVGIESAAYFSGDDYSLKPENVGGFADLAVFKAVQLKVLSRLLEANKRGDLFSESDIKEIMRNDEYIPWMVFMTLLKDIDSCRFDSNIAGSIALCFFYVGNNLDMSPDAAGEAGKAVSMLSRVPGLAEEFNAYRRFFSARYSDAAQSRYSTYYADRYFDATPPAGITNGKMMRYCSLAALRCFDERDVMTGLDWQDWPAPIRDDMDLLYGEALQIIAEMKAKFAGHDGWLINAPSMQYPAILPLVAVKSPEVVEAPEAEQEQGLVLSGATILDVLKTGFERNRDSYLNILSAEALRCLRLFGGRPRYWFIPDIAGLNADDVPIKQGAKECLETEVLWQRLITDDKWLMEDAAGAINGGDLIAYMAANVLLNPNRVEAEYDFVEIDPEDEPAEIDPAVVRDGIEQVITGNLQKISNAISSGNVSGKRPIGLSHALVDFASRTLGDRELKYGKEVLDSVSFAPVASALMIELRQSSVQMTHSIGRALMAAEKMLTLDGKTGYFSAKRVNIELLADSIMNAKKTLAVHAKTKTGSDAVLAASALARLNNRDKSLDSVLFDVLFNADDYHILGYRIEGLSALAADRSSGIYEKLLSSVVDRGDLEKAVLSAYVLTEGIDTSLRLSGFDINTATEQEICAVLSKGGIPSADKMAKHIVKNRPYEGFAGFRAKKVNGLGQNKDRIADILERANVAPIVEDILQRALCSEDPALTAMAIAASNLIKRQLAG